LAASGNFGTVVRRNYPLALANRMDAPADEVASVVGCLCTPLDRLADRAALPKGAEGDLVAVFCAGAYGATASPAAFLGHGPAKSWQKSGRKTACPARVKVCAGTRPELGPGRQAACRTSRGEQD
jgi:hypothetical protein